MALRQYLLVAVLLISTACVDRQAPVTNSSQCSDPLGLYTRVAYRSCCATHDRAYAIGGSEPDRLAADRALMLCVAQYSPEDAASMFTAVRLFGRSRFHYKEIP